MSIARRVIVVGRVQGVGFRYAAVDAAERIGVAGWVRNLPDGRVEAFVEGADDAVEAMLRWLGDGPPSASVDDVTVTEADPAGSMGFRIR
ncbi:acylphosphatase [Herbiconiux sp. L3-i23]|uniref:acylphosphatase n=1 Tax=Herbiconiux sp. L3-i23 TaxID=2905871 RepID=UPI0020610F4D|nr:acylphosphatase [Herbiconiux sp. L3-i23]BDI22442.1 acylphosphatase [Herbiconiux sp. L3-i23]